MPVLQVKQHIAGDFDVIVGSGLIDVNPVSHTSTAMQLVNSTDPLRTTTLQGTGLVFDPITGAPIAGTVTGMNFYYNGALIAEISGASMSAASLFAAIIAAQGGDNVPFDNLVSPYSIDFDASTVLSGDVGFAGSDLGDVFQGPGGSVTNSSFTVEGGKGADTYHGGTTYDEITYSFEDGTSGININLVTGTGTDTYGNTETFTGAIEEIWGSSNADTIVGSASNNGLAGLAGNDTLDGGAGTFDTLRYDLDAQHGSTTGVSVDLAAGTATDGFGGTDTISNFEHVVGTDFADTLSGDGGINDLQGGKGNDIINTRDNDGAAGEWDRVTGGDGTDTITYADARYGHQILDYGGMSLGVVADIGSSAGTVNKGTNGADTLDHLQNVLNTVDSGGFALIGSAHDDTFNLGGGANTWMDVRGGAGDDTFNITSGDVRISYNKASSGIVANLATGTISDGEGGTDTVASGHVREVRGSDFADSFTGSSADESFITRGGNDTVDGGGGIDRIRYDRSGDTAAVSVDLATGTATGEWHGTAFTDTLTNIENVRGSSFNDFIGGSNGNNELAGKDGDDILSGLAGDDNLKGGLGSDQLYGGDGNDMLDGGSSDPAEIDYMYGGVGNDTYIVNSTDSALDYVSESGTFAGGASDVDTIISKGAFFWDVFNVGETLTIDATAASGAVMISGEGDSTMNGNDTTNFLLTYGGTNAVNPGAGIDVVGLGLYGLAPALNGVNTVVLTQGDDTNYIYDFESGTDKIDVSDYGRFASGAQIVDYNVVDTIWGSYIYLGTVNGQNEFLAFDTLHAADLAAGDFVV